MDIIRIRRPEYSNNSQVIQDALMRGLDSIRKGID